MNKLRKKTYLIIEKAISDIKDDSNFFSTIAGSRTLAMLASFEDGRKVISLIVARKVPISIFSYARSQSEIDRNNPPKNYENKDDVFTPKPRGEIKTESNMPNTKIKNIIFYRSSTSKPPYRRGLNITVIAPNENVLTVLIDELNYDWFKFLFNRILLDSGKIGPGCLSSLTDALLYLEEGRRHSKSIIKKNGYRILRVIILYRSPAIK